MRRLPVHAPDVPTHSRAAKSCAARLAEAAGVPPGRGRFTRHGGLASSLRSRSAERTVASAETTPKGHDMTSSLQPLLRWAVDDAGSPGIVTEIRSREQVWFGAAGMADMATGRRREPGERFRIGSLGKAFTATVVLKLEAEGRLSLDDTVEKWLPGAVRGNGHDGSKITIRQLLNQTSGIANIGNSEQELRRLHTPAFREHRFDVVSAEEMVRRTMEMPPALEPGTGFAYSNTNFLLAGMIIETVTGRSYADELERVVIMPLELSGTYLPRADERRLRGPHPHPRQYSRWMNPPVGEVWDATEMTTGWGGAAGAHVSTTADICRFIGALASGALLPAAQHQAMWTTVSTEGSGWIPEFGLGTDSASSSTNCPMVSCCAAVAVAFMAPSPGRWHRPPVIRSWSPTSTTTG